MFNETEWDDTIHAFPKTRSRDRRADDDHTNPLIILLGSLALWTILGAIVYFIV